MISAYMKKGLSLFIVIAMLIAACVFAGADTASALSSIPSYGGTPYKTVENNNPSFTSTQKKSTTSVEKYYKLDDLGRCTKAYANIGKDLMPTSERGDISSVHPSGWQSGMGWERCHLIGFQLTGENANERNLITGTRYMNVSGMLPFENMIADYIKETGNHVLYRVTPMYKGDELIARGVHMEAWSVEDKGDGICFNVFCFNVQPGKKINYSTGKVTSESDSSKKTQKITIGVSSKSYKVATLKKESKSFSIKPKSTSGNIKCTKSSGSKKLSVSTKGKVTVKKGTKKGTYTMKVKIYAKSTSKYKSKTVTKTITVNVGKASSSATVYWTPSGKCYHSTKSCSTLSRSKTIVSGSLSKAKSNGLSACKVCH